MRRSNLKHWLSWQPQPTEFLALLQPPKPWPVQMDRYTRGIDNTRIDVYLSPRFCACAKNLTRLMVRYEAATHFWGEPESHPQPKDLRGFRDAYRDLVEGATARRGQLASADSVRLIHLSLLKYLLLLVPREIQNLRRHLEKERDEGLAFSDSHRLTYDDRIATLARKGNRVAYQVYQRLFKLLDKLETLQLRKPRKSLVGVSWPLPREALFNPLLQLPDMLAANEFMHHYPMLFGEDNGSRHLDGLNRCVTGVFSDYLPAWAHPRDGSNEGAEGASPYRTMVAPDHEWLRGLVQTDIVLGGLLNGEEYRKPRNSWLDDPENLIQLLYAPDVEDAGRDGGQPADARSRQWRHFRSAIGAELVRRVERMGIMPQVVASYWTPRIHRELGSRLSAQLLFDYIAGRHSKRRLRRRLRAGQVETETALSSKTLDFAANEARQLSRESRSEYAQRLLLDFLRLRRDLKLAYKVFEAMDRVRLLGDEQELALSRANNLIYEFRLSSERGSERCISGHVILKADVRGSTRITTELRARRLNPATHFSQNFFDPINELLADFGAGKVFVEGDAVILSLLEEDGGSDRRLSVAHACGLSARILDVVARQNTLNRRYGLPELELGLGIAFCSGEPTYLYDGNRRITISPAINLADRLSSCSQVLRAPGFEQTLGPFRVEVLTPTPGGPSPTEAGMDPLRYNVNGIELDAKAFAKLKSELSLRRMDLRVSGLTRSFHVGRYPDRKGRMQWLVVREAPLRAWDGVQAVAVENDPGRFYEVVVDPALLTLIRSKLRAA
jgi:class 3 adenylate cyclase